MIGALIEQEIRDEDIPIYLNWRHTESQLSLNAPGFIKRTLTREEDRPNVFHYLVYWETKEHIDRFTATPEFQAAAEGSGIREVMKRSTLKRVWVTEELEVRAPR